MIIWHYKYIWRLLVYAPELYKNKIELTPFNLYKYITKYMTSLSVDIYMWYFQDTSTDNLVQNTCIYHIYVISI